MQMDMRELGEAKESLGHSTNFVKLRRNAAFTWYSSAARMGLAAKRAQQSAKFPGADLTFILIGNFIAST
jgi:hypothetical protein